VKFELLIIETIYNDKYKW